MSFLKAFGRGLLSFLAFLLLSLWFSAAVLQMTLLNRDVVQGWLKDSGLYQNLIPSMPTQINQEGAPQQTLITSDDFKAALGKTFPPSYIQEQAEKALDATYDWIEGKQPAITFSIPVQEKQKELSANLAKQIEPKLAKLPGCATILSPNIGEQPNCLPQGMSAANFAAQLTKLEDNGQGAFLSKPITQNELAGPEIPNANWLPAAAGNLRWLTIALPIGALAFAAAYVFVSDSKLRGLAVIGRRFVIHGGFAVIAGGALWYFGSSWSLSSITQTDDLTQRAIIQNSVDPLLKTVLPTLGQTIVLLGSIPAILGAAAWIAGVVLQKRLESQSFHPNHPPSPPSGGKPAPPTILD